MNSLLANHEKKYISWREPKDFLMSGGVTVGGHGGGSGFESVQGKFMYGSRKAAESRRFLVDPKVVNLKNGWGRVWT